MAHVEINKAGERPCTRREPPEPGKRRVTLQGIVGWAKAEASLAMFGPVGEPTRWGRENACKGCPDLRQSKASPDAIGFCGACSCGESGRARLSLKVTMPAARCPKRRWPND